MSSYEFDPTLSNKSEVFQQAARILLTKGFKIIDLDIARPWGFFLSVDEAQASQFIDEFYEPKDLKVIETSLPLRPKLLGIAPGKRLSWQYHHRRSEVWKTLAGSYSLVRSKSDNETHPVTINENEVALIDQGMRHRGIGLNDWALVAEIWQHTIPSNPSDEEDIIRVQDDFGR